MLSAQALHPRAAQLNTCCKGLVGLKFSYPAVYCAFPVPYAAYDIFIKHAWETLISITSQVFIEVKKANKISASVLDGSRASASHPQIHNKAKR